jgi:hypothetical protein
LEGRRRAGASAQAYLRKNEAVVRHEPRPYRRLDRNARHLRFVVTAMNMKRVLVLMEQN